MMFELLQQSMSLLLVSAGLLGLLIGSFLNVVIHRLPIMLENRWQRDCAELNNQNIDIPHDLNLSHPRSHCPHCRHPIKAIDNIPLLSYIILAGRCRYCHHAISLRYPLIELTTALLSALVVFYFGFNWTSLGALIFTWFLITLSFIDIDHRLLPDNLTLPLLWLGLLFNLSSCFTTIENAVLGASIGYLSLWSIFHLFRLLTGKHGMGYGDFKLLAALGAWLGWMALPSIILLSSLFGAIVGSSLLLLANDRNNTEIPFGPYLAVAGLLSLFWGEQINNAYLTWAGLT